jgi:phosphotransferase system HPr (HPr) family protein
LGRAGGAARRRVQQSADAMTAEPLRATVTLANEQGLHVRPIASFVRLAMSFQCGVRVIVPGKPPVDGRSGLELMTLGAEKGTEVTLEVSGPDQEQALKALVALLEGLVEEDKVESPGAP